MAIVIWQPSSDVARGRNGQLIDWPSLHSDQLSLWPSHAVASSSSFSPQQLQSGPPVQDT